MNYIEGLLIKKVLNEAYNHIKNELVANEKKISLTSILYRF
jgi:hypothetical protein